MINIPLALSRTAAKARVEYGGGAGHAQIPVFYWRIIG